MSISFGVLKKKLETKRHRVAVIGLGYVGLPLATAFAEKGIFVYGLDVDQRKVDKLLNGKSYISTITSTRVRPVIESGKFVPSTNFAFLRKTDCVIICVPTPLTKTKDPDLQFIIATTEQIRKYLHKGQLVVLESTTYPGTTDEVMLPVLESTGLKEGKDFFLAFSPEREDPGNKDHSVTKIPKVVGGVSASATELAVLLYGNVAPKIVPVSSARVAEAVKMLENTYRAVNIALVNELKMLFERMDIDVWEVINTAATKPFGYHAFYPGPGLGGHCIPIDPFYLSWKAKQYNFQAKFIELAGEVNVRMPEYVVGKVIDALNVKSKSLNGAKVLILGVAYKKNVDDIRESPALEIIELLEHRGAKVMYHDPFIPAIPKMRKYDIKKSSVSLTPAEVRKYDCVVVVTDHDSVDYGMVLKNTKLIVDSRNVFPRVLVGRGKAFLGKVVKA